MAVEEIILEKAGEKKHIVLKHRHRSPRAAANAVESPNRPSSVETPNRPLSFETPRASLVSTTRSSVASSVKSTPAPTPARTGPKYVSSMAKARLEKKRREAARESTSDNKSITSSDMETSSNPSTESTTSDTSKRSGPEDKRDGTLPKFGDWDKHSVDSGPCYTLLFQNAAQEKKTGGPVRVHAPRPPDPSARNEDLYAYNPAASVRIPRKQYHLYSLLCCFKTSDSP